MKDFEFAAKRSLLKYVNTEESLKPLLFQSDRAIYLAEESEVVLKVYVDRKALEKEYLVIQQAKKIGIPVPKIIGLNVGDLTVLVMKYVNGSPLTSNNAQAARETGKYLKLFHNIGAKPPFSGGQHKWDEFVLWWSNEEIQKVGKLNIFSKEDLQKVKNRFKDLASVLASRSIVMLHGDLQAEHVLVDVGGDKVIAFLDFVDSQAGDPLLDIAVLTLWDKKLADLVLEDYEGMENSGETQNLLSAYRLLRHIAEIPWLLERDLEERAEKNINAVKESLLEE